MSLTPEQQQDMRNIAAGINETLVWTQTQDGRAYWSNVYDAFCAAGGGSDGVTRSFYFPSEVAAYICALPYYGTLYREAAFQDRDLSITDVVESLFNELDNTSFEEEDEYQDEEEEEESEVFSEYKEFIV